MSDNANNSEQGLENRVAELLSQMTLREKIALLSGKNGWSTVAIERLGIPSITMTDGPHGVRASNPEAGRKIGLTTCFPSGVSMAASWNPALIERVGAALGEEARAMDCDILLGPCVNIVRSPLAGRNFEAYSEDPYLAGRIAVAMIRGVQSQKVGTSLKHYAANNHEIERGRASSNVDERTLREIYLSQFEMAVKEAQPWTVMCSYNRINGTYASQHDYLLNKILKDEWGFMGFVVSDWGANHTIFSSVTNGLDLEMPGPAKYYRLLGEAVFNWQIDEAAVTEAARRVLRIVLLSGRMDGNLTPGAVNTPAHQTLARELAEDAITLLKNEGGVLPIGGDHTQPIRSIAVLGPNAAEAVIEGGGSSHVDPPYRITPLEALKQKIGDRAKIEFEQGCNNYNEPTSCPISWLSTPDGSGNGLKLETFKNDDFSGAPAHIQVNLPAEFWMHVTAAGMSAEDELCGRWTGRLMVPTDGNYTFKLNHTNWVRLYLNDELILESRAPQGETFEAGLTSAILVKPLLSWKSYDLRLDYVKLPGQEIFFLKLALAIFYKQGEDARLARAVELARQCDMAIVFAGNPEGYESEGGDRPDMELPGGQNELIAAVAQANPRTVVVLNAGSPVSMPWIDRVAAVMEAYYPGQENGNAVTRILLGEVNPSGKLPETFPRRLEDNPAYINSSYPGAREVNYGEGIFVGYRYYDQKSVEPLFPFGHGLSYTSFEYSDLQSPKTIQQGESFQVSVTIKNTGSVAGKEVVQVYISDPQASLPRPPKELKGFAKVLLQPGETQAVTIALDPRSLSFYDPYRKSWVAEPGKFEILVGSSSRDIRARVSFELVA